MTDQEQNIAVAETLGWQEIRCYDGVLRGYPPWFDPDQHCDECDYEVPNYGSDLNAIREVIMAQPAEVRLKINHTLMESLRPNDAYVLDRTINATAAQRREAFLRTVNKWKEAP